MEKTITAEYNWYGYTVEVDGEEVYRAGNCPWESTQVIDPLSHKVVPLETIKRYCEQTAGDIAEDENGNRDVDEVTFIG